MVAYEGVPLHSAYFAKLWYEIYHTEVSILEFILAETLKQLVKLGENTDLTKASKCCVGCNRLKAAYCKVKTVLTCLAS